MFDREAMFSYRQAVAASANSTDVVFTGYGDAGPGQPIGLEVNTPAVDGGGSVLVDLQHADDPSGTFETHASWTISADDLARGGAVLAAHLPSGLKDYLRLNYTLNGTVTGFMPTAGLLYAGQTNRMR